MMAICPACGQWATMLPGSGYSVEPHGEMRWEEWNTCVACGARCGDDELDEVNEDADIPLGN